MAAYFIIGEDGTQIGYDMGSDTHEDVINRYKDYKCMAEIDFYDDRGRYECTYDCKTKTFHK